jgi:hypothetical protein
MMTIDVSAMTIQHLARIGVQVLEPATRPQTFLAAAMADFATYCLHDEPQLCRAIIDKHMALAEESSNNNNDPQEVASSSIGELQGGSDEFDIYRLSFPTAQALHHHHDKSSSSIGGYDDDDDANAAMELLHAFVTSPVGRPYRNVLTFESMRRYMLDMCERRLKNARRRHSSSSSSCNDNDNDCTTSTSNRRGAVTRLVNVMLILALGPTPGQPRHVDHMHPNVSIFLSMSQHCPSTIIYDTTTTTTTTTSTTSNTGATTTKNTSIANTQQLIRYWQDECDPSVPTLLQTILNRHGSTKLKQDMLPLLGEPFGSSSSSSSCSNICSVFSSWDTIDSMLQHFGKLYQSISARALSLPATKPGTTLIVGGGGSDSVVDGDYGNYVHAGPPTSGPRMLCFAVGILKEDDEHDDDDEDDILDDKGEEASDNNSKKENDGEVQYNPVLFHADLCCILFTIMDHYQHDDDDFDDVDKNEDDETYQSKWFLLHDVLVPLMKGMSHDHIAYERLLGDDRRDLRDWLQRLTVAAVSHDSPVQVRGLVQEAIASNMRIFCCSSPDSLFAKNNKNNKSSWKKKMARQKNKETRRLGKKQTGGNITHQD